MFVGYEDGPQAIRYFYSHKRTIRTTREYRWPLVTTALGGKESGNKLWSGNDETNEMTPKSRQTNCMKRNRTTTLPDPDEDKGSDHQNSTLTVFAAIYTTASKTHIRKNQKTLREAMNSPETPEWDPRWEKAELDARLTSCLREASCWQAVDRPLRMTPDYEVRFGSEKMRPVQSLGRHTQANRGKCLLHRSYKENRLLGSRRVDSDSTLRRTSL